MRRTLTTLLLLAPLTVLASPSEDKGLAIAKSQDAANEGFKDNVSDMAMILKNAQGDETKRFLRAYTLEVKDEGEGDKSKMIFDQPADVKGTAILTYSHGIKGDDQWLFLPATKRVKRLNSQNKSGPFLGSEFAYEDLSSPVVEKYSYNYIKKEKCGAMDCHVVERKPLYPNSGYTRQLTWVDTAELRTMKIEYYDRKNTLLKTLVNEDFKKYAGKYWRAGKSTMSNVQTGKSTILLTTGLKFGTGLKEGDFDPASLEGAR